MNKIVSFSLWGDNPKYIQGAIKNAQLIKKLLPDWKPLFWVHEKVNTEILEILKREGSQIILIEEKIDEEYHRANKNPGWFWRFKILEDPTVDLALVRDTDCRITIEEVYLIRNWEKSGKEFHIIRDNKMHRAPILAGLWGFTKSFSSRINLSYLLERFEDNPQHQRFGGYDQQFLAEILYPLLNMKKTLVHDSHHHYNHETAYPIFKTPGNEHFMGKDYEADQ